MLDLTRRSSTNEATPALTRRSGRRVIAASASLVVLLALLPSACGSVVVNDPGRGSTPEDLGAACSLFAERRAAYRSMCAGFSDAAADEKALYDDCVGIATAPGSTLAPADIAACADALLACTDEPGALYPSCTGYGGNLLHPNHDKRGTAAPGAACFANVQCATGYCDAADDSCGHCVVPRAPGESCAGEFDACTSPAHCDDGTCRLPGIPLGEECIDYAEPCQAALYCKPSAPDALEGACVTKQPAGAACDDATPCAPGLFCDGSTCAPLLPDGASCATAPGGCEHACLSTGICGKPEVGLTAGADCSDGDCGPDLSCEAGVCTAIVYAQEGESCLALPCASGLVCNSDCPDDCMHAVCEVAPKAGQPCVDALCGPDGTCIGYDPHPAHPSAGLCAKYGAEGEPCPCEEELACVKGRCVVFGAAVCE